MSETAVTNMVNAMVNIAQESSAAGRHEEAIGKLTTFIDTVEKGDKNTQAAFGPHLPRMYALRAKCLYDNSGQGSNASMLERARLDVEKADAAFHANYGNLDPAQKINILTGIHNILCPDETQRMESIALVSQVGTNILPAKGGVITPASASVKASGVTSKPGSSIQDKLPAFGIGAVLWAIPLLFFISGIQSLRIMGLVVVFVLWLLCMYGWRNFPVGGGGGTQLKMIVTWIIMATIIGMILIAYWTGLGIFRLRNRPQ